MAEIANEMKDKIVALSIKRQRVEMEIELAKEEHIRPRKDELKAIDREMREVLLDATRGQMRLAIE